jgi:hypothetical protein
MHPLLNTFDQPFALASSRPRSIDIVWTDPQQLVAAYTGNRLAIIDLESQKMVLQLQGTKKVLNRE